MSVVESRDFLTDAFRNGQSVLCEGAHGTLIDRDCGFPPYVTRRRTTAGTVRAMLDGLDVTPAFSRSAFSGPSPSVTGRVRSSPRTMRHLPTSRNGTTRPTTGKATRVTAGSMP